MKKLSGWGRFPVIEANEVAPKCERELLTLLQNSDQPFIARGNGRSYGDSSINKNLTISMTNFNRFIDWNEVTGELIAESGVLLSDVINYFLPLGWFPFVTPGTKFVTLGGAIASDVHGKNHHLEGSFGNYINWFEVIDESNNIIRCSKTDNPELFQWTIGGMGLTGIITKCSMQLKKVETGWIKQNTIINNNLKETLQSFDDHNDATYSVAWIDCLTKGRNFGRSLLFLGEHALHSEVRNKEKVFPNMHKKKLSLFFNFPSFVLNNISVSIFNFLYFSFKAHETKEFIDWDKYFYPLDSIGNWNRLYGKKGFFQFQCVLPSDQSYIGYKKILTYVQQESSGSFLAILKKFGPGNGNLSFPREGYTLALDFKASQKNIIVAQKITKIVKDHYGSIYLSKDALMDEKSFSTFFDADLKEKFSRISNKQCSSAQSNRLKL